MKILVACIGLAVPIAHAQLDGGTTDNPPPQLVWPAVEPAVLGQLPKGRVDAVGPTDIQGKLEAKHVGQIVARGIPKIKGCYESHGLSHDKRAKGKIGLTLIVNPTGTTASVRVDQYTLGNPWVRQCIEEHAATLKFVRPGKNGARFSYVFSLEPAAATAR